MNRSWMMGILLLAAGSAAEARSVKVNGELVAEAQLKSLEQKYQVGVRDGDYWYDDKTGAWGLMGGPQQGLIVAGLGLGGPLASNASGGGTGTWVNGRELHPQDVQFLRTFTQVWPGRFWVDSQGNGGYEGGPAIFNLVALARQAQVNSKKGSPWSYYKDWGGGSSVSIASDGQGEFYFTSENRYTGESTTYSSP